MSEIKMIATDMDGTLLADDKRYEVDKLADLLDVMKERGIRFVSASGNQDKRLEDIFKPLIDRGYEIDLVASNGSLVASQGKIIHASLLTDDQMRNVINWNAANAEYKNIVILNAINGSYVSNHASQAIIKLLSTWYYNIQQVEKFAEVEDDILEVTFQWAEDTDVTQHVEQLRRVFGDEVHSTGSGFGSVDILAPGVNKATGLQYLQDRYNIRNDEVVTFGDNQNDLEMLLKYPKSYVMPNAERTMLDLVKQKAEDDNNHDGVLKTIEKLLK